LSGKEYKPKSKSLPGAKLIPHLCARIRRASVRLMLMFTQRMTDKIKVGRMRRYENFKDIRRICSEQKKIVLFENTREKPPGVI
jgi:hypothetical protein